MKTKSYNTITIDKFMGLYKRGMADQCPQDHAICCENVVFGKVGEWSTRPGTKVSRALNHVVIKSFLATFNDNTIILLTLDNSGNLYRDNDPTPILSLGTSMADFEALNMNNKCYILPLASSGAVANLKVWDGVNPVRDACGLQPTAGGAMTAVDGASDPTGGLDPGIHKFAVSYETDTGFITKPGPIVGGGFFATIYNAPGAKKVDLSGIPTGPSHIVARHILVTRANEEEYFFAPGGRIANNSATTLTLNFFDSDLVISADYLFDLLTSVSGGPVAGALAKYHNRMLVIAGSDLIRVSRSGDQESFSDVNGFIQIPAERDGNVARAAGILGDTLYITKAVGVYATEDNGDFPSTWVVSQIEGAVGSYQNGMSSITGSQQALSFGGVLIFADRAGLFMFNGNVIRPPLTWKINDLWQTLTHGFEYKIFTCVDPYENLIYCILPTLGNTTANLVIVGDFSEGLSWESIKWAVYFFPFTPTSISMMNFLDDDGLDDYDYYLRIGTLNNNNFYKLRKGLTDDSGTAILSYYQTYLGTHSLGDLNIFTAIRFRAKGTGTLLINLFKEDMGVSTSVPSLTLSAAPGLDLFRQINFTGEKMSIYHGVNGGSVTVDRLDIFGKSRFKARPA